jgi:4-amino-4-deoxy-L-arabinose transferase-like glycosyltransferase
MSPSREHTTAWLVFALALCVRWLYLWEVWDSSAVRFLSVDSRAYHDRALEILSGAWLGERIFYQDPLYPYFLAGLYGVFGPGSIWVLLAQGLLGAGAAALVYGLAAQLFERRTALVAAALAIFYKPFLYYDALVLKVTLSIFLITLALFWLVRAQARGRKREWLLGGLALGLACLTRGNYLVLIPVVLLWLWLADRGDRTRLPAAAGALALGLVLVVFPVTIRNYAVGGDLVLITSQAGQNFFIGNHRGNASGIYKAPPFVTANPRQEESCFQREALRRSRREMLPSELSRYWFGQALREIRLNPGHFASHTVRKARLFFNEYEVPDNQDYQFFEQHVSRLLALPLLDYGLLLPLALCGAFFARRNRGAWLLTLFFASYGSSVILFYNMSRYRIPVAPVVIVFSAVCLSELAGAARRRRLKTLAASAVFLALAYAVVHQPVMRLDWSTQHYNLGLHLAGEAARHVTLAEAREAAGDNSGATSEREQARRLRERAKRELRLGLEIRPRHQALKQALRSLLVAWVLQAEREERSEDAVELARELTAAYPDLAEGHWRLGANLARLGETRSARIALERALAIEPGHAGARLALQQLQRPGTPSPPQADPPD